MNRYHNKPESPDEATLQQSLAKAIRASMKNDEFLWKHHVGEWALNASIYRELYHFIKHSEMSSRYPELTVDLDYDRVGTAGIQKGRVSGGGSSRLLRPDIAVHQRGNHKADLLAIECKVDKRIGEDLRKLGRYFYEDPLNYKFGAVVRMKPSIRGNRDKDSPSRPLIAWFSRDSYTRQDGLDSSHTKFVTLEEFDEGSRS